MKQKLSNLIEFGADQGNVKRTVFYDITCNKLFVGNSVPFPMIFLPGAGAAIGTFIGGPIGWAMDGFKIKGLNNQSITDAIGNGLKTVGGWFS